MRIISVVALIIILPSMAFPQDISDRAIEASNEKVIYSYAYISVDGKAFSRKLKVKVDFGDTPEQIAAGIEYSEILTNKKSYAAVLNYMAERHFELVETRDYISTFQGTGETSGIIFIMRKKI